MESTTQRLIDAGLQAPALAAAPIATLESLREHLQWAIELEHATIPPYLCALYSIEPGRNLEATEVVCSVVLEEMLHMTLAATLLNAVGGAPPDHTSKAKGNLIRMNSQQAASAVKTQALGGRDFRIDAVPEGSAMLVGDVAVFHIGGEFCATQARCTHRQGPLSEGTIEGSTVTCPWHGAQFNVCTGAVLRGPAVNSLKTYRVIVEGEIGRVEEHGDGTDQADTALHG